MQIRANWDSKESLEKLDAVAITNNVVAKAQPKTGFNKLFKGVR